MNAVLLLNDAAGSLNGDRAAVSPDDLRAAFAQAGTEVTVQLSSPNEMCRALEAAIATRPPAIFVGGGDGTVSTAAGCLAGSGIPLGVLPLGTLNHFARDLGLPNTWQEAVATLAHSSVRAVDVGAVNGRVFINNCSIGSYPEAVRKREALRRRRGAGKWWAMTLATIAVFRRLRRLHVHLETDQNRFALRTPFVLVGNNRYSGRVFDESMRPRLDAGVLSIYTTRAHRRLAIVRLAWQALLRRLDRVDGLDVREVRRATITSAREEPLPIAIDGELVALKPPLQFEIRRGALRVLAGAASAVDDHHDLAMAKRT